MCYNFRHTNVYMQCKRLQKRVIKLITLADVAKEANVSTATVSRYLNNPEKVKKKTAKIIQEVVERLNYTPNIMARALVTKESKTIGIIIPDIDNLFFPAVLKGIQKAASDFGYHAIFVNTDNSIAEEKRYIESLKKQQVDAFIFMGSRDTNPEKSKHIEKLAEHYPTVMINDYIMDSNIYSVMTDEIEGSYIATKSLIQNGHLKIFHITVESNFTTATYKKNGYLMAMNEAGIPVSENMIFSATSYANSGITVMDEIIESGNIPSAVFCGNDQIAIGAMTSILNHRLKIPDDISIIGFSNIPISESVYPSLTTVGQFPNKIGYLAVETTIKLIKGEEMLQKKIVLKTEFLQRKSTMNLNQTSRGDK